MSELITERLCLAAFCLGYLTWLVLLVRAGKRSIAKSAAGRCPKCGYDAASLPRPICPECGLDLNGRSAAELRRAASIGKRGMLAIFALVGTAWPVCSFAQELLQINRLVKVGMMAFVPGWSYFDDTFDGWDCAIIAVAIALFPAALLIALGGRQRPARRSG